MRSTVIQKFVVGCQYSEKICHNNKYTSVVSFMIASADGLIIIIIFFGGECWVWTPD
jgi:hypothetical protein